MKIRELPVSLRILIGSYFRCYAPANLRRLGRTNPISSHIFWFFKLLEKLSESLIFIAFNKQVPERTRDWSKVKRSTATVEKDPKSKEKKRSQVSDQETEVALSIYNRFDRSCSYSDLVPIQMGYSDLLPLIHPQLSEADRVVKHILDKNILVRYYNVEFSHRVTIEDVSALKRVCPNFRHLRFTPGPTGDDGKIEKKWQQLVKECALKEPIKCLEEFANGKKVSNTKSG